MIIRHTPWHTKPYSRCTHTMNIVYNTLSYFFIYIWVNHTTLELCSLYSIMLYIIQVHKYKSTALNETRRFKSGLSPFYLLLMKFCFTPPLLAIKVFLTLTCLGIICQLMHLLRSLLPHWLFPPQLLLVALALKQFCSLHDLLCSLAALNTRVFIPAWLKENV